MTRRLCLLLCLLIVAVPVMAFSMRYTPLDGPARPVFAPSCAPGEILASASPIMTSPGWADVWQVCQTWSGDHPVSARMVVGTVSVTSPYDCSGYPAGWVPNAANDGCVPPGYGH